MKRKHLWTAAAALAGIAAPFAIEAAQRGIDRLRYAPPGEMVIVRGRRMHVYSEGEGPKTIVFLPGLGTPCPAIDFMPLVTRLRRQFRCVIPEPFGYGYSDAARRPRTSENIVEELREGLRAAGFRPPYVLLGHSIAGIYMLTWAARYPSEVEAVIGDDTSLPTQFDDPELKQAHAQVRYWPYPLLNRLGLMRLYGRLPLAASRKRLSDLSGGDPSRIPRVRSLSARNTLSRTIVDEARRVPQNCRAAQRLRFPKACRLLHFVAQGSIDSLPTAGFDWLAEHQKQALSVSDGRCVLLPGDHYLHHTEADAMAREIREFLSQPQPAPAAPVRPVSPIRRFAPGRKN